MRNKHRDVFSDIIADAEVKKMNKIMNSGLSVNETKIVSTKQEIIDNQVDDDEDSQYADGSDVNEYHIIYQNESNIETTDSEFIVLKQEKDQVVNFSDDELTEKVRQLLNLLVDDDTLTEFGWPEKSVEDVLNLVIEQCGQSPADYTTCPDYATKIRENTKLLFTTVIDNESIKELLNNQTIDEVILHVLKTAG